MQDFSYQHLNSIRIEPDITLLLEYSEPDQGGTRLLHRFYIYQNRNVQTEVGYSHDERFQRKAISIEEVPRRVFSDALVWIAQQLECVPSGRILAVLNGFQETLSSL